MFPAYEEIEAPLLDEIHRRGGRTRPGDRDEEGRTVYDVLADYFRLTPEDRQATIAENGVERSKWENMVRWARRKLVDRGALSNEEHGVWQAVEPHFPPEVPGRHNHLPAPGAAQTPSAEPLSASFLLNVPFSGGRVISIKPENLTVRQILDALAKAGLKSAVDPRAAAVDAAVEIVVATVAVLDAEESAVLRGFAKYGPRSNGVRESQIQADFPNLAVPAICKRLSEKGCVEGVAGPDRSWRVREAIIG